MIASIPSATLLGVRGRPVLVEVHVSNGLPGFAVVGLPDAACREARDRVRAALLSSGLPWPLRRVTVNLAPSGVRKTGAGLDLPIAIGLLVATGELDPAAVAGCGFVGELGLDGTIRSVPGALPLTDAVTSSAVVVPAACVPEALLVGRRLVRTARSLRELVDALAGRVAWPELTAVSPPAPATERRMPGAVTAHTPCGQRPWRACRSRATYAASRWVALPSRSPQPAVITSCCQGLQVRERPCWPSGCRAFCLRLTRVSSWRPIGSIPQLPCRCHRRASAVPLSGHRITGSRLRRSSAAAPHGCARARSASPPTACCSWTSSASSLRALLDMLRQPLEEGVIRVARARATVSFPARFLLVAAMNPCPCGERRGIGSCVCSAAQLARYARRLSGPLLGPVRSARRGRQAECP